MTEQQQHKDQELVGQLSFYTHRKEVGSHHFSFPDFKKFLFPLLLFDLGHFIFKVL